ncbi:MAG TPA: hypothetical protein VH482_22910 [Thermomicrobiales bacterium]
MTDSSADGHDDPFRHTHELRTALTGVKAHAQLLLRHLRQGGPVDPVHLQRRVETIDLLSGRMVEAISRVEDHFGRGGRSSDAPQRHRE